MIITLSKTPTVYINLDKDIHKDKSMKMLLRDFDFVYRVSGTPATDSNDRESVNVAIADAYRKALDALPSLPGTILEDDCKAYKYRDAIDVPDDADVLFLGAWNTESLGHKFNAGGHSLPMYERITPDLYKAYSINGSHAIVYITELGESIMRKSLDLSQKTGIWHDWIFGEAAPFMNAYVVNVPVFTQTSQNASVFIIDNL